MIRPEPPRPRELLSEYRQNFPDKPLLIAFDFDGTLVSIVPRPDLIEVPIDLCEDLQMAARAFASDEKQLCRLAIVTGRALQDLTRYVPECPGLDLIGNHGLEWWIWDRKAGLVKRDLTPETWIAWREGFLKALRAQVAEVGGEIEDKRASLTLHYRHSGAEYWPSEQGRRWLESHIQAGTSELLGGKAAWNLLPAGASKGASVRRYCEEFRCERVVFFGDEPTDETVFSLQKPQVIGVKVGGEKSSLEGGESSAARYGLKDVQAARRWLSELANLASG